MSLDESEKQNDILLDDDIVLGSEISETKMEQELRLIKVKTEDRKIIGIITKLLYLNDQYISCINIVGK